MDFEFVVAEFAQRLPVSAEPVTFMEGGITFVAENVRLTVAKAKGKQCPQPQYVAATYIHFLVTYCSPAYITQSPA